MTDYYSIDYLLAGDSDTDYDDDEDTGLPLSYRLADEALNGDMPDDDGEWQDEEHINSIISAAERLDLKESDDTIANHQTIDTQIMKKSKSKLRREPTVLASFTEPDDVAAESTATVAKSQPSAPAVQWSDNCHSHTIQSDSVKTDSNRKVRIAQDSSADGDSDSDAASKPEFVHDPFYDAELDAIDAKWVQAHGDSKSNGSSDAVLSCPNCFTTLTFQCQQHTRYSHQFRAVLVMNCVVNHGSTVIPKGTVTLADYKVVSCAVCGTEVGAQGDDDVIEFFNVLPSSS